MVVMIMGMGMTVIMVMMMCMIMRPVTVHRRPFKTMLLAKRLVAARGVTITIAGTTLRRASNTFNMVMMTFLGQTNFSLKPEHLLAKPCRLRDGKEVAALVDEGEPRASNAISQGIAQVGRDDRVIACRQNQGGLRDPIEPITPVEADERLDA